MYTYGDVCRQIEEYIPARQRQGGRSKTDREQENPVVLKTDHIRPGTDNGKRYDYCIAKAWKARNHLESACYTKKSEDGKKEGKTSKTKAENKEWADEEGVICHITIKQAGEHTCEK